METRTAKYKEKRKKLKLDAMHVESVYLQNESEELLRHTKEFMDWWKHYELMEDFKPK